MRPASDSPLLDPVFRRLFAAQVIALVGTGLSTVALVLFAYELAGGDAGTVLGTALALKMIAFVVVAPLIGGLAQRLPRRATLIALDIVRAVLVAGLIVVDAVWQVYLLIFLLSACSAAFTPIFQAAIPDVLRDARTYARALSLSRLAYELETLLSPTLAAAALALWSYHSLFAGNAVGFLISAGLVMATALPAPAASERPGGVLFNLTFGLRAYLATPRLRGVLALHGVAAAAGAMVIVNTVVYVRDRLGLGEAETAYAFMAAGAGAMRAAVATPRLLDRFGDRRVMLAGGLIATGALALGTALPGFTGVIALWALIGAGGGLIQTPVGSVLRRSCRESDRATFFAANFALSHLAWLAGYLAAGWFGAAGGLMPAMAGLAVAALAATVAAAVLWPASDQVVLPHRHDALWHDHPHGHDDLHHAHRHEDAPTPTAGEPRHTHRHYHPPVRHAHRFVIDVHHPKWPRAKRR